MRRSGIRYLKRDSRGTAVLEFALVAPFLLAIMFGIVAYGGYFWRAHALQQVANDAARAAIAGLTGAERGALARAVVAGELQGQAGIKPESATVDVAESGDAISVEVGYDAAADPFMHLGFVPLPASMIRRRAVVRLGGL